MNWGKVLDQAWNGVVAVAYFVTGIIFLGHVTGHPADTLVFNVTLSFAFGYCLCRVIGRVQSIGISMAEFFGK